MAGLVAVGSVGCHWRSAAASKAAELRRDPTKPAAGWWPLGGGGAWCCKLLRLFELLHLFYFISNYKTQDDVTLFYFVL